MLSTISRMPYPLNVKHIPSLKCLYQLILIIAYVYSDDSLGLLYNAQRHKDAMFIWK